MIDDLREVLAHKNLCGSNVDKQFHKDEHAAIKKFVDDLNDCRTAQLQFGANIYGLITKLGAIKPQDWTKQLDAQSRQFSHGVELLVRMRREIVDLRRKINDVRYNKGKSGQTSASVFAIVKTRADADALASQIAGADVPAAVAAALQSLRVRFGIVNSMHYEMITPLAALERDHAREIVVTLNDMCALEKCRLDAFAEPVPRSTPELWKDGYREADALRIRIRDMLLVMGPDLLVLLAAQFAQHQDGCALWRDIDQHVVAFRFIAQIAAPCNCMSFMANHSTFVVNFHSLHVCCILSALVQFRFPQQLPARPRCLRQHL